jgi:hypothetical protein
LLLTLCVPFNANGQRRIEKKDSTDFPTTTQSKINTNPPSTSKDKFNSSNIKAVSARQSFLFEENKGQTDSSVKFLSRGQGYNLFLTSTEIIMSLYINQDKKAKTKRSVKKLSIRSEVVKMKLLGANPYTKLHGVDELSSKSNYLIGKDPKRWQTDVPNFASVKYENVYPAIDMLFRGGQQLEYDFIIAPNANPNQVKFAFEGVKQLRIDKNGNLALAMKHGEIQHQKPFAYQVIDGNKRVVSVRYELKNKSIVGFDIGKYDANYELIIDPTLIFSSYLGGNSGDRGRAIDVDKQGNVYITGETGSTNFPVTSGAYDTTNSGQDAFVVKMNANGEAIYSTYLGGSGNEIGNSIAADEDGNAYITGVTYSMNFPVTAGAFQTTLKGSVGFTEGKDAFVTKLNPNGNGLVFSTYLGGNESGFYPLFRNEEGTSLVIDSSRNVLITGFTTSNNFPTTPGAFQTTRNTQAGLDWIEAFVTKMNFDGTALIYSTFLGGTFDDEAYAIAVDTTGNAFVAGTTDSVTGSIYVPFPTTSGSFQPMSPPTDPHCNNYQAGFITKLNPVGSALVYSTYLGGNCADVIAAIDIDASGNAFVTGETYSTNFPTTPGVFQPNHGPLEPNGYPIDSFVTKINASGSALVYSSYIGRNKTDLGRAIAVNSAGNAFVAGISDSTDLPVTQDALISLAVGGFILKISINGNAVEYASYLGGNGHGLATDSCDSVYISGFTSDPNFLIRNAYQSNKGVGDDGFSTKISFPNKVGIAPDTIPDGPNAVTTPATYQFPASVDTDVLDLSYLDSGGTPQPLQVELWATVYRPATLASGTQYPVLIFLHGMHLTCERNSEEAPPGAPPLPEMENWYSVSGICDNPNTPFIETRYYDIVENHRGYDYLGQKLASWGYIIVSINANRGVHADEVVSAIANYPDPFSILPRGRLVLRHLQRLSEWNSCTGPSNCTPTSLGIDLRGKLDFSNVGLFGHSRGGQGIRGAYNLYREMGSLWPARILNPVTFKGIFELAPTDRETNTGIWADPSSKFIADGTKWNVLLPMCDADVSTMEGVRVFDRMMFIPTESNPTQKSSYTVWGANHNFYNTKWTFHDNGLDKYGDYRCIDNDPLFDLLATGSEKQRLTAISSVVAFFRANVGAVQNPSLNQNFNPRYEIPSNLQAITRVERGFTPSPHTSFTKVFDDFLTPTTNTYDIGTPANVVFQRDHVEQHDPSLNVAVITWTASGNDKFFQTNWSSSGSGVDISSYQTLDFRISRFHDTTLNPKGQTNFSIRFVMADGSLSAPIKLCKYIYLDGPVGGYGVEPVFSSSGALIGYSIVGTYRPLLQTVRIQLTDFAGANLSQVRGIRFTFDETQTGRIHLANIRLSK